VPDGSVEAVVIAKAAALMVNCNEADAMALALSVTCTVKLNVPLAVGPPESVPVVVPRERPLGSFPTLMLHEYGCVPPVAPNVTDGYGVPTVPTESDGWLIVSTAAAVTLIDNDWVLAVRCGVLLSQTLTVKLNSPLAVGVPEIVPVVSPIERPLGSCPLPMLHEYGCVPPVAPNVACGYGVSTVPPESDGWLILIDWFSIAMMRPPRRMYSFELVCPWSETTPSRMLKKPENSRQASRAALFVPPAGCRLPDKISWLNGEPRFH
jgi:hypothetical protein